MGMGARLAVKDPLPKKIHVSESMDMEEEQKLVNFFTSDPIFCDQTLKEFKDRGLKDHLLAIMGAKLGLTGRCTFFINRSSNIFATL